MYQGIRWNRKIFSHSSINMNSTNFERLTAIGFTIDACYASPAIEVRNQRHYFRFCKSRIIGMHNLCRQFVSKYTRVGKIWLCTFIRMQICSTNANSFYFNNSFSICRNRLGSLLIPEDSRRKANQRIHSKNYGKN